MFIFTFVSNILIFSDIMDQNVLGIKIEIERLVTSVPDDFSSMA